MHVLLTGATGAVGRAVVARLLSEGHQVSLLTRRPFLAERLYGEAVRIHEWHPLSEDVPHEIVADVDAILHMLGTPFAGGPSRGRATLVVGSRGTAAGRLVEAARGRVGRLIAVSIAQPSEPREPLAWEADVLAARGNGMSVAIVRLGLVAAASAPILALANLARHGFTPDLRGAEIPAIGLADAAAMLSGLLGARAVEGIIDGVAPEPLMGVQLAQMLKRHNRTGLLLPLPAPAAALRLGEVLALLQSKRRIVPDQLLAAGARFTEPDPTALFQHVLADLEPRRHRTPAVAVVNGDKQQAHPAA